MLVLAVPGNCGIAYSAQIALIMSVVLYGVPPLIAAAVALSVGYLAPRMLSIWRYVIAALLVLMLVDGLIPHASCSIISGF